LHKLKRHLTTCIAYAIATLSFAPNSIADTVILDIPQQSLSQSLIRLGKQHNISIIFPSRLVNGRKAPALKGTMSLEKAFKILLKDSNIDFSMLNDRVIRLQAGHDHKTKKPTSLPPTRMEEVAVIGRRITGSRLRRHDLQGSTPVDIISAPQIAERGSQSVGELLKFLPAVSGNSTSTSIGNGGNGTSTVTLRGLPASNTLVLINGRRVANNGFAGQAVDLNSIAPDTIERIEILKNGASAIYGSDAIAGVVNINLKSDFEGLSLSQYYGASAKNDLGTTTSSISFGKNINGGNITFSASHFEQDPIFSRDRTLSASADGRMYGGTDQRSSAIPGGRFTLSDNTVLRFDNESQSFIPATDNDLYNFSDVTSAVSESQRDAIYLNARYPLNTNTQLSGNLAFTRSTAVATLAATPIFTAFSNVPLTVSKDNIYNPFKQDIKDIRYRAIEAGPRVQNNESNSYRANLDLSGDSQGYHWVLNWNWSRAQSEEFQSGLFDSHKLQRALGPSSNCQAIDIDGCTPVDLFSGNISTSQLDYISATSRSSGDTELSEFSATFDREIFQNSAGTAQLLAGISYRNEKSDFRSRNETPGASFIGGGAIGDTQGKRDVREVFFEAIIPLMSQQYLLHSLDLELAARHSDYSDFGKNTAPRAGLRYRPHPDLLLRFSYAEGFRAPSLQELYAGTTESNLTLTDPCSIASNVGTLTGCKQQSDPTLNQFLIAHSGNDKLKAEVADTRSIGLVWSPEQIESFLLSLDYFDINQRNVVGASGQFIINQNANFNRFSNLIERGSNGNIRKILAPNLNIGKRNVGGLDLQTEYSFKTQDIGQIKLSLNAAHIYRYHYQVSPSQASLNLAGSFSDEAAEGNGALPKWKLNGGVQFIKRPWQLSYNIHYVSSLRELNSKARLKAPSWTNHNLQINYHYNRKLDLSFGIDNLFDKQPPFLDTAFLDNHDARTYDIKGRYWYTRLNYKFM